MKVDHVALMGDVAVVVCGRQRLTDRHPHPIVVFFQGIEVYFYTAEAMIDTCTEGAEQPSYRMYDEAPIELEIWDRHNPGIFRQS